MTRALLLAGALGPALFVGGFLLLGATRPDYDPVFTFVSQLSLDGGGEWQIANFIVSGLFIVAFGLGLRRLGPGSAPPWGWRAVVLVGVALIGTGVFVDDPWLGYPPGATRGIGLPVSWHGWGHLHSAAAAFLGFMGAFAIFARVFAREPDRRWLAYSVASAVSFPLLYAAALVSGFASANPSDPLGGYAGLLQRASAVAALAWVATLAVRELRRATANGP